MGQRGGRRGTGGRWRKVGWADMQETGGRRSRGSAACRHEGFSEVDSTLGSWGFRRAVASSCPNLSAMRPESCRYALRDPMVSAGQQRQEVGRVCLPNCRQRDRRAIEGLVFSSRRRRATGISFEIGAPLLPALVLRRTTAIMPLLRPRLRNTASEFDLA